MQNANRQVERTRTCSLEERCRQKWNVQGISGPQLLFIHSGGLKPRLMFFTRNIRYLTTTPIDLNLRVNKPADMWGIEHERILLSAIHISKVAAVACFHAVAAKH